MKFIYFLVFLLLSIVVTHNFIIKAQSRKVLKHNVGIIIFHRDAEGSKGSLLSDVSCHCKATYNNICPVSRAVMILCRVMKLFQLP